MEIGEVVENGLEDKIVKLSLTVKNTGLTPLENVTLRLIAEESLNGVKYYKKDFKINSTLYVDEEVTQPGEIKFNSHMTGNYKILMEKDASNTNNDFTFDTNDAVLPYVNLHTKETNTATFTVYDIKYHVEDEPSFCDSRFYYVNVTYTVQNVGFAMTKPSSWQDQLTVICMPSQNLVKRFYVNKRLRTFDYYSNWWRFTINKANKPDKVYCKIVVTVNLDNGITDIKSKHKESCCFYVPNREKTVLNLTILNKTLSNLNAGDASRILYTLTNTGRSSDSEKHSWLDGVYLHKKSKDLASSIIEDGVFLGSFIVSNLNIKCNETSKVLAIAIHIPRDIFGSWYLFAIHDIRGSNKIIQLETDNEIILHL